MSWLGVAFAVAAFMCLGAVIIGGWCYLFLLMLVIALDKEAEKRRTVCDD